MSDVTSDDGGAAFPNPTIGYDGMSLRDWFAGQAMSVLANSEHRIPNDADDMRKVAKGLYRLADAMIAVRNMELK